MHCKFESAWGATQWISLLNSPRRTRDYRRRILFHCWHFDWPEYAVLASRTIPREQKEETLPCRTACDTVTFGRVHSRSDAGTILVKVNLELTWRKAKKREGKKRSDVQAGFRLADDALTGQTGAVGNEGIRSTAGSSSANDFETSGRTNRRNTTS